jgi:hypothetical protein
MIYTHTAAALLGAALAATGAWQVQNWRYSGQIDRIELDQHDRAEQAIRTAMTRTVELHHKKDEALNDANKRAQRNAAAAAAARTESDGLRQQLAATRDSLPSAACASVRDYAATVNELLGQCAGAFEDLARAADGHSSDALMFEKAWPR